MAEIHTTSASRVPAPGGLAAISLRYRRGPWVLSGLGAFAIGAALALIDALLLPVFRRDADQAAGPVVLVPAGS